MILRTYVKIEYHIHVKIRHPREVAEDPFKALKTKISRLLREDALRSASLLQQEFQ